MKISDIILLTLLGAALLYLLWALLSALLLKVPDSAKKGHDITEEKTRADKKRKKKSSRNTDAVSTKELKIQIRQESDGIHFVIPPSAAEIQSEDDDIFPDIINDIEPDDKGLDAKFWNKVACIVNIQDPETREQIALTLHKANFISEDDIAKLAQLTPIVEENDAIDEEPQIQDKHEGESPEYVPIGEGDPEPVMIPEPEPEPEQESEQEPSPEAKSSQASSEKPKPQGWDNESDQDFEKEFNI